ncbi:MAG: MFS transporter [Armatimonadetes bacterium]|nr:MFS transporter [Armatimonadota bacterium]
MGWLHPIRRFIYAAFLMDFSIGVVMLAGTWLAIALGASPTVLGLLGAVASLSYTAGCLFSGRLSDRFGRRPLLLFGCGLTIVAWLGYAVVSRPWQIGLIAMPAGLGMALYWPPYQAWLAELTGGGRRELNGVLGLFNVFWSCGLMLGPVAAGLLWPLWHPLAFLVGGVGIVLVMLIALTTPNGADHRAVVGEELPETEPEAPHDLAGVYLRLAWLGNFAASFALGASRTLFPKLAVNLHYSDRAVGVVVAALNGGQFLIFLLGRVTTRWHYRRWPLYAGQSLALCGMLLAAATGNVALFGLAFLAAGMASGTGYLGSLFYSLHGHQESRGGKAGLHEAILGSGMLLGPLCGGLVADWSGSLRAPYLLAALVMALTCWAQTALWRRARSAAAGVLHPSRVETAYPVAEPDTPVHQPCD